MTKKGISLVGIKDDDTIKRIIEKYPDCYFELSYLSTKESLKRILPIVKGRVASTHMLAPQREWFPNLASNSAKEWSEKAIMEDAELALEIGAKVLVLHPGYLYDGLVSTTFSKRLEQIESLKLTKYEIEGTESVASSLYIETPQYKSAFSLMVENALSLKEKLDKLGLILALENLNPRTGYIFLHPDEAILLSSFGLDLCIDVGHLMVNAAVFGFDVLSETKRILDTNRVKSMHLHSNESKPGLYKDSHKSLDKFLPQWKEIISYAEKKGSNLILETLEECERNVGLLFN